MVRPALRSSKLRKKYITTPGGRHVIHYKRKKPGKARCAMCYNFLSGTSTGKSPNRPYGGYLCSKCLRKHVRQVIFGGFSS